jgi:CubicO group peptidase (beta-lactamase class C family)
MKTKTLPHKNPVSRQAVPWLLVCCLLFFTGQAFLYGKSSAVKPDLSKLDRYIENARKAWKVPGMSVAIVKDGKILFARGYGLKEFSKKAKVDEHTLFAIASNTKAFTAAAVAMLVDEGKVKWDDKVRKFLPYFQLYDQYVTQEITVRDLLCHRSGLGTFSGDLLWYETAYTTVEVIKRARYLEPKFPFRSGYGYSNIMFMAAGEVVHEASGIEYKQFIQDRILTPLGMTRTIIGTKDLKNADNVATPHHVPETGQPVTVPYTSSDSTTGAAGINSSAFDMAQWLMLLLDPEQNEEKQILSVKGLQEMSTPHNSFKVTGYFKKISPTTHFRAYGLGLSIYDYHGRKVLGHGGALDGMISRVVLVPEMKFGFVILTNSINSLSSPLVYKILDTFMGVSPKDWSAYYLDRRKERREKAKKREAEEKEKKQKEAKRPMPKFQVYMEDYAGRYGGPMYGDAEVALKDGKLVLNLLPAPVFISDLSPLHYDTFELKLRNVFSFIPKGKGTVQFLRDKKGKVVEMVVDIPNNDFWFTELEFKKKNGSH